MIRVNHVVESLFSFFCKRISSSFQLNGQHIDVVVVGSVVVVVSFDGEEISRGRKRRQPARRHVRQLGQVRETLDVRLEIVPDGVDLVQLVPVLLQTLLRLGLEVSLGGHEIRDHLVHLLPVFQFLLQSVVVLVEEDGRLVNLGGRRKKKKYIFFQDRNLVVIVTQLQ